MKKNTSTLLRCAAFTGLSLGLATSLHASLILNDPFATSTDFSNDWESASEASWQSGTASWAGDSDYALANAGGMVRVVGPQYNAGEWRSAQHDFGTALSGEFWVSMLIQAEDTTTGSGAVFALENGVFNDRHADGFGIGISGDGNLFTREGGDPQPGVEDTNVAIPQNGGWTLVVSKITVNGSGAADSIDFWAFDDQSTFGLTEASLGSALYSSSSVQYGDDVQDIWLGAYTISKNNQGKANFDNIRISDLAGDAGLAEVLTTAAVPEPSTYALLLGGLALTGVMLRRRRRG
ncbi:MAG: PEP-CTERM sorting domain-containing protein [Oceanipulchritudo sp.]